jgi:hypothetical protein
MGERDSRCSLIKRVRDKGKVFFFLRFLPFFGSCLCQKSLQFAGCVEGSGVLFMILI